MAFEVCIQRRGDRFPTQVFKKTGSLCEALAVVAELDNLPFDTIEYVVIGDDGFAFVDTRRDGLCLSR